MRFYSTNFPRTPENKGSGPLTVGGRCLAGSMIETDTQGFAIQVDDLDADWVLSLIEDCETQSRIAERRKLRYAAQWCRLHPVDDPDDEEDAPIGGHGTPAVAVFAAEPLGAAPQDQHPRRPTADGRRLEPRPPPPPDLGAGRVPRRARLAGPPHRPGHRPPVEGGRRGRGPGARGPRRHLRQRPHRPRHRDRHRPGRPRGPARRRGVVEGQLGGPDLPRTTHRPPDAGPAPPSSRSPATPSTSPRSTTSSPPLPTSVPRSTTSPPDPATADRPAPSSSCTPTSPT
jgi:hypothetical protein